MSCATTSIGGGGGVEQDALTSFSLFSHCHISLFSMTYFLIIYIYFGSMGTRSYFGFKMNKKTHWHDNLMIQKPSDGQRKHVFQAKITRLTFVI